MSTERVPCGHPDWEWNGALRRCLNPVCGLSFEPPPGLASGSTSPVAEYTPLAEYDSLRAVLERAARQAESGKGKLRHALDGEPFEQQQIVRLGEWMASTHFEVGQACKKALESTRLPRGRAVAELLGAINYLAAAVLVLERGGLQEDA